MKAFVKVSPAAKWFPLSQISCRDLFGCSMQDLHSLACRNSEYDDATNVAYLSRAAIIGSRSFSDCLTVVKLYDL